MPGRSTRRKIAEKEVKDASTQTSPDGSNAEIIRLTKTVELYEKQIQQLKAKDSTIDRETRNSSVPRKLETIPSPPVTDTPKSKVPGRGCTCKGKCASKICGCVKKNMPCSEFCRCDDSRCQNQEPDKENIGDPNSQNKLSPDGEQVVESLASLKLRQDGKGNRSNGARKGVFSPDDSSTLETLSLSALEIDDVLEFANNNKKISFDSDSSSDTKENSEEKKVNHLEMAAETKKAEVRKKPSSDKLKRRKLLSPFNNNKTPPPETAEKLENFDNEPEFSSINPMKPTRQLPRTPVTVSPRNDQLQMSEGSFSTSEEGSAKEVMIQKDDTESTGLDNGEKNVLGEHRVYPKFRLSDISSKEPTVDWEEHCAQLVPCKLCKRKFYPHRIAKHEASCKRL